MTKDLKDLYMAVLKKGLKPKTRKNTNLIIDLETAEGYGQGSIMLVPNDFLRAIKTNITSNSSTFFLRLREHDTNIRTSETNAPPRPIFLRT